jgi:hypothetical protein
MVRSLFAVFPVHVCGYRFQSLPRKTLCKYTEKDIEMCVYDSEDLQRMDVMVGKT